MCRCESNGSLLSADWLSPFPHWRMAYDFRLNRCADHRYQQGKIMGEELEQVFCLPFRFVEVTKLWN